MWGQGELPPHNPSAPASRFVLSTPLSPFDNSGWGRPLSVPVQQINVCKYMVHPFLSRVSILTRDIDIANLSVRPSVRNVPVSDENGLTAS